MCVESRTLLFIKTPMGGPNTNTPSRFALCASRLTMGTAHSHCCNASNRCYLPTQCVLYLYATSQLDTQHPRHGASSQCPLASQNGTNSGAQRLMHVITYLAFASAASNRTRCTIYGRCVKGFCSFSLCWLSCVGVSSKLTQPGLSPRFTTSIPTFLHLPT